MMKVAVTGASGFIGTALLEELNEHENIEIIALTRSENPDAGQKCRITWCTTDYSIGNLTDVFKRNLPDDVDSYPGCEVVIHLAGVRGTEEDPEKFLANDTMTENVLEAMIASGVRKIIFASTVSVYDDERLMPWKEEDPVHGRTEYGRSKARCETLIKRYAEKYSIEYSIVRIAQVLGEGEKRRGMMNVFIDKAREHGTLRVMGRSEMKRQYIYVRDLAEILSLLAFRGVHGQSYDNLVINVGMPNAYTNLEIAQMVNMVLQNPSPIDYDDSYSESGRSFYMDITRLREMLGFNPRDMIDALSEMEKLNSQ